MLSNNVPYPVISQYLYEKGIKGQKGDKLSTQSVSRHCINHFKGKQSNRSQIPKGKIKKVTNKAKDNLNKDSTQVLKKDQDKLEAIKPQYASNEKDKQKTKSYIKTLEEMKQDIDVINEYLYVLAVSKERVERSVQEEADNGMVLATTGNALKDYARSLKDFHDVTSGMESITALRFTQMVQMINNVFMQAPLDDATRAKLLQVLTDYGKEPINPPISMIPTNLERERIKTKINDNKDSSQ